MGFPTNVVVRNGHALKLCRLLPIKEHFFQHPNCTRENNREGQSRYESEHLILCSQTASEIFCVLWKPNLTLKSQRVQLNKTWDLFYNLQIFKTKMMSRIDLVLRLC